MRIIHNGTEYLIRFTYLRDIARTFCHISLTDTFTPLASGHADCSVQDNFSRAVGRKLALSRAIQSAFPRKERMLVWLAIWEARKAVTKKPWSV